MTHNPLKRKEDIGLSPYELKFRGKKKADKVDIRVTHYDTEGVQESNVNKVGALTEYKHRTGVSWINIDGLHNETLLEDISQLFAIPADILSDVLEPSSRPQVEDFGAGLFVSIKMLEYDAANDDLSVDNLSMIVLDKVLITFQEKISPAFEPVRERIRRRNSKIHRSGTDYLAFALLDVVIDNYIYLLGQYGEKVEQLEERLILGSNKEMLAVINGYKQQLNDLRVSIKPAKEMISSLVKLDSNLIDEENERHFKELQDNINQATELLEYYREVLLDELNLYHMAMSAKLNDIMSVLTIFSVIFIPLTFIVGVYGMNFNNMPELSWRYGYFVTWGIMLLIVIAMVWYFKRKKWF